MGPPKETWEAVITSEGSVHPCVIQGIIETPAGPAGRYVAEIDRNRSVSPATDAEFITRAANAHADLVAALKALMEIQDCTDDCWCVDLDESERGPCEACMGRAAIAKAEGR